MTIIWVYIEVIIPMIIGIAIFTLCERKVMGIMQRRIGPNKIGKWGILQPIADALKLIIKDAIIPKNSNKIIFLLSPMLTLLFSFLPWSLIPYITPLINQKEDLIFNLNYLFYNNGLFASFNVLLIIIINYLLSIIYYLLS